MSNKVGEDDSEEESTLAIDLGLEDEMAYPPQQQADVPDDDVSDNEDTVTSSRHKPQRMTWSDEEDDGLDRKCDLGITVE